jgi:hypothetical protein
MKYLLSKRNGQKKHGLKLDIQVYIEVMNLIKLEHLITSFGIIHNTKLLSEISNIIHLMGIQMLSKIKILLVLSL